MDTCAVNESYSNLVQSYPSLEYLDIDLSFNVDGEWQTTQWPVDRKALRIAYHEGERTAVRLIEGNVRLLETEEQVKTARKEAEKEWIVSPYEKLD